MSRCAAPRIASRVVLPSRVLAVGLGVSVGVLIVVICTNRSVQKATPREAPRQARDRLPEIKGQTEEHPQATRSGAAASQGSLSVPALPGSQAPRSVTAPPGRFRAAP